MTEGWLNCGFCGAAPGEWHKDDCAHVQWVHDPVMRMAVQILDRGIQFAKWDEAETRTGQTDDYMPLERKFK